MSSITLRPRNRKRTTTSSHFTEEQEKVSKRSKTKTAELEMEFIQPFLLDCKENLPPTLALASKSHASHINQPLTTPPSTGGSNVLLHGLAGNNNHHQSGKVAARKPLPFPSATQMGQAQALASVLVHPGVGTTQQQQLFILPTLSWTDSAALWQKMRDKDSCKPAPEADLHLRHPSIIPSMRTILLDWMLEVCEEYRLHRETYYLAVDIYDRFMDTQINLQKEQLQLVGVTCLFMAAKIEEIYPPKLSDFAYVTDGACLTDEIVSTELIICKALNWRLNHHTVTVNTWMNIYMQLSSLYFRPPGTKTREFEMPSYSPLEFMRAMQVVDLCSLDLFSRQFSNSVLAASALYLSSEKCRVHLHLITGYRLSDIHLCIKWMQPLQMVINEGQQGPQGPAGQKYFKGVLPQNAHNIQTHEVSITMLDEAMEIRKYQEIPPSPTPVLMDCSLLMTPPKQERRFLAPLNTTTV